MAVVSVLISDLPDLQGDVVAALVAAEPDLVVVGSGCPAPLARIAELAPDVVLLSFEQLARALSDDDGVMLSSLGPPGIGLLAIAARHGTIVRAFVVPDEHAWPGNIVEAIRSAAPNRSARHRREAGQADPSVTPSTD